MVYQNTAERFNERRQLCSSLDAQIKEKKNEQERQRMKEREEELRLQSGPSIDPTRCPHGKKYICTHCQKSYPRKYLSKRQLKPY